MHYRLFTLMLVVALPAPAGAQNRPVALSRVSGSVLDSASLRPPVKTFVCASTDTGRVRPAPRCGQVDSAGAYRIDSVIPGRWLLSVQCTTREGPGTEQIAFDRLVVSGSEIQRNWIVSMRRCDTRPLRRVTGAFRGHFTPGFESSLFIPCPTDTGFLPSDSLGSDPYQRSAWVVGPARAAPQPWPSVPRDPFGNPRYYVEWSGTIIGPGHYGHMGVSPFELRVDSVFVARAPQHSDCR